MPTPKAEELEVYKKFYQAYLSGKASVLNDAVKSAALQPAENAGSKTTDALTGMIAPMPKASETTDNEPGMFKQM